MSRAFPPVPPGVKRLLTLALTLVLCTPLFAIDVDPKLDRAIRELLPICSESTVKYETLALKLPPRFTGVLVTVESPSYVCDASLAGVVAPSGAIFLGTPWPIGNEEGKTTEEKLKNFAWRNLHEQMTATIDPKPNADGLHPVVLHQTTTAGKQPLDGLVDAEGKLFFWGRFRPAKADVRASRVKVFDRFAATAPSKGATKPAVTILEFSDFQCPSCQRAANYVAPILEKHSDRVRYVRIDLPLSNHSWAFAAATSGRAIHRQNPELFWEFKKQVYDNQANFNPFTFWDWARGFAADHDLDVKAYDKDLLSKEIADELLASAGTALTNDIRATPTYMINGTIVDAGEDGKALAAYVEKLLAK